MSACYQMAADALEQQLGGVEVFQEWLVAIGSYSHLGDQHRMQASRCCGVLASLIIREHVQGYTVYNAAGRMGKFAPESSWKAASEADTAPAMSAQ